MSFTSLSSRIAKYVSTSYVRHTFMCRHRMTEVKSGWRLRLLRFSSGPLFLKANITLMLPPDRRKNKYARSNFESIFASKKLLELCQAARASGDNASLFEYLDGQKTFEDLENLHSERQVRLNLKNLTNSKKTIEFRCSPPSRTAATACHWAAWTLSFIFAAGKDIPDDRVGIRYRSPTYERFFGRDIRC